MSDNWVLKEGEAVELLALLITSARIQMEEPAHYGPLRLFDGGRAPERYDRRTVLGSIS